ncbi:MAG: class I SAM-dependent methyltransferase [Patescibacteria group bacterium]|nr:class I SAM-dependent methyltransferase [Patescibacteria group bacterium]
MDEYQGKTARNYNQTRSKDLILNPILDKYIPCVDGNASLLDVGCGHGFYYQKAIKKGYTYWGIDISPDMISQAKNKYPNGNFSVLSATSFSKKINIKFDVILFNYVLSVFSSKKDIFLALKNSKQALKRTGIIIIGHIHPCFDSYMKKWLFKRSDIQTTFKGYFSSGIKYKTKKIFNNKKFIFQDYHWKLSDYIDCIIDNDLKIIKYDECKPNSKIIKEENYLKQRLNFPSYQVFVLKK